jgi:octaprenyl-diphosphate synthase
MKEQSPFMEALIDRELVNLKAYLHQFLQASINTPFKHLTQYVAQIPGKQVRPRLVFLIAGAHGGITDQTRRGAGLVALIHQASLIHDDVIDEADQRQGRRSVNAAWGNKKAILIGDYLLTKCINLALSYQDYTLLKPIAQAAQAMTEGELLQLAQTDPLSIKEDTCLEIIHKKTASLMGACSAIGAISSDQATDRQVELMHCLGMHLGMAFQIQDDLLDYNLQVNLDKNVGMDIRNGRMTLPLLYALQQVKKLICQAVISKMSRCQQEPELIPEIIDFAHRQGGVKKAQKVMRTYRDQALRLAEDHLLESTYKTALVQFLLNSILGM